MTQEGHDKTTARPEGGAQMDAQRAQQRGEPLERVGLLSRALEVALEGLPERVGEGEKHASLEELERLDELTEWLSVHLNVSARACVMSARELAHLSHDSARLIALCPLGWLAVSNRSATLISSRAERPIKLSERALKKQLGAVDFTVIELSPQLNLEPLGAAHVSSSPWRRLWALARLERPLIGALFVYALALGALSLSVPVAVQVLVNTIAFGSLLQPLVILALLLLGVLCLSGGVKLMELYAVELLQRRLFARVAEDLSRRLSSLTQEGADKVRKKGLANRFFEVVTLQKATSKLLADGLSLALQATVGLLLLGFYHPILLIFDVALLTGVGAIVLSGWGAVPTAVRESEAKYEVAGWLERLARGEESDVRDAEVLTRRYLSARRLHYRKLARQLVGGVALQILAMVGLLGLGGWLVMKGELTLGQLVAAELVVGSLGASFVKLGPLFEGAYDLLASVDKLGKIIDLPQAHHTERAPQPKVASALPAAGSTHGLSLASRALGALALLAGLGLGFTPWQQSVTGSGRVVAYAPLERQQVVEAPIEGRVIDWFVQEGSEVKAGDPIAELSDNDPEILGRLERERAAAQAQVEAATLSIELTEARIRSEESARGSSISTARMKINMARDKVSAAERSVDAAEATLQTARLNLKRLRRLQKKGLSSQRELEVAELTERKARNDLAKAKASLRVARSAVKASEADQNKVGSSTRAKIESTRSSLEKLKADRAKAEAELAKVEVRLARQNQMKVLAPRDGVILRLLAQQGTEMVKAGDPLVTLVPSTEARAVEVYVDGNDAPLIEPGREVRLQFEGWPAVQFVGWPSVAVGTFGGLVSFVDAHGDKYGRFRVVVTPKEGEAWPEGRYLRQGVRANGWILLNQVSLGFELWRQFNGFPPALSHPEEEQGDHKKGEKSSSSKGSSKDKGGSK